MKLVALLPPLYRIAPLAGLLALIALSQAAFGQEMVENKRIIGGFAPLKNQSDNPKIEYRLLRNMEQRSANVAKNITVDAAGSVQVVMLLSEPLSAANTAVLEALGATIQLQRKNTIQVLMPENKIETAANLDWVEYVRLPHKPATKAITGEGQSDIGADLLLNLGVDGSGAKVAVLDLGFSGYASLLGNELPASVGTRDFTGGEFESTLHGSAVAEIIHDIAPGAELTLVAFNTSLGYLAALDWIATQDFDIVSASIGFDNIDSFNGDGVYAKAASELFDNSDTLYINAAGNEQQQYWTGSFTDGNATELNEFGAGDDYLSVYIAAGNYLYMVLNWDDWGSDASQPDSDQDYDVFVWCPGVITLTIDTICGGSFAPQSGDANQQPIEMVDMLTSLSGNYKIGINRYTPGSGDHKMRLLVNECTFVTCFPANMDYRSASATLTHPAEGRGVLAVGAYDVSSKIYEGYSSQGPTWDGRLKPDIAAPDNVSTASYGALNFSGTSAATPHVAGLAALLKSQDPSRTAQQLRHLLLATSQDENEQGKDNFWGAGRARADALAEKPDLSAYSGFWYNPEQDGHGFSMDFQGDTAVVAWYVYDNSGVPLWLFSVLNKTGDKRFAGAILSYRGPLPSAPLASLFNSAGSTRTSAAIGSMTIDFANSNLATVSLNLDGDDLTAASVDSLKIQHFAFAGVADDGDNTTPYLDGRFGLWGDPTQNGHGFFVDIQNNTIVIAWYVYDVNSGDPYWVLAAGSINGNEATLQASTYSGPRLSAGVSLGSAFALAGSSLSDISSSPSGTINVTFQNDNNATLQLNNVIGINDFFILERLDF